MTDPKKLLDSLYRDVTKGTSFGGARDLQMVAKQQGYKIPMKTIQQYLRQQPSHVQFKPLRHRFQHNMMRTQTIHQYWFMDLGEVQKSLVFLNHRTRFLLVICDALSKLILVEPLPNKTGPVVAAGLARILDRTVYEPAYVIADAGAEFRSRHMMKLLSDHQIQFLSASATQSSKAFLAENAVKLVFRRLYRFMVSEKTKIWYPVLQDLVAGLNSRKLASLKGLAPRDITPENQTKIAQQMQKRIEAVPIQTPKFSVGQTVLVAKAKGPFVKAYRGSFDPEPFVISKVVTNKGPIVMYSLSDQFSNAVLGLYYETQLTPSDVQSD